MSYTIIPQTININSIVDDDTIKVIGGNIALSEEMREQIKNERIRGLLINSVVN